MIDTVLSYYIDMSEGVQRNLVGVALLSEDNLAHTFEVTCKRNGTAADLEGASVSAYFVRADGVTIPMSGSISGSTVSVQLNASCYMVTGRYNLVIKLAQGETISTIFWATGAVYASKTDALVDTGEITMSMEELFAKIEACEMRVKDAETQAVNAATQAASSQEAAADAQASATAAAAAAEEAESSASAVKTACEEATTAANEAADRANQAADNSAVLTRVEAVAEQVAANTEAIITKADASAVTTTLLWSGTWENGSITVPGISNWRMLQVVTSFGSVLCLGGSVITGVGGSMNTNQHRTLGVRFSVAGDACTLVTSHYIVHNSSGNHGALTNMPITAIYGLLKG